MYAQPPASVAPISTRRLILVSFFRCSANFRDIGLPASPRDNTAIHAISGA
jgi:hypothetical protein